MNKRDFSRSRAVLKNSHDWPTVAFNISQEPPLYGLSYFLRLLSIDCIPFKWSLIQKNRSPQQTEYHEMLIIYGEEFQIMVIGGIDRFIGRVSRCYKTLTITSGQDWVHLRRETKNVVSGIVNQVVKQTRPH